MEKYSQKYLGFNIEIKQICGLLALWLVTNCAQISSCVACGDDFSYPNPLPLGGEIQDQALVASIQESGVAFLASHLSEILGHYFPTYVINGSERAVIALPEKSFGTSTQFIVRDGCIGPESIDTCPERDSSDDVSKGPTFQSFIELDIDKLDQIMTIEFLSDAGRNAIQFTLTDLDLFLDVALAMELSWLGNATCRFQDSNDNTPAIHLDSLSFSIYVEVDEELQLQTEVADVSLIIGTFDELSILNLDISPCNVVNVEGECDDPFCHGGWWDWDWKCPVYCAAGDFAANATSFFEDIIAPLIESVVPPVFEMVLQNVLASLSQMPMAMSMTYDVSDDVGPQGEIAPFLLAPKPLDFGLLPHSNTFQVSISAQHRNMLLSLNSGTAVMDFSPCVPMVEIPSYTADVVAPVFDGTVEINGNSESYHLALAISQMLLSQLSNNLYLAGMTCWSLDAVDVEALSNQSLSLALLTYFARTLVELGDPYAPLLFVLHPTQAPEINLGSGRIITYDQEGIAIVDSLIQVDLGEVGLSIYVFMEEDAYVRLTTVAMDVSCGLSIDRTPNNQLEVGLDDIKVENTITVYNELIEAVDFSDLMEVLMQVMIGAVVNGFDHINVDIAPFVSATLGDIPLVTRIHKIEKVGKTNDLIPAESSYLAVYISLCDNQDLLDPFNPVCYSGSQLNEAAFATSSYAITNNLDYQLFESGKLLIELVPGYEYRYRVDKVVWSVFRSYDKNSLHINNPLLKLSGVHTVEVEARPSGQYWVPSAKRHEIEIEID